MWPQFLASGLALGAAALLLVVMLGTRRETGRTLANRERVARLIPTQTNTGGFVSSQSCEACHPGEHASWHRSFHRTMTQLALPENVLGRFDGSTVDSGGLTYKVTREGDTFWAEMPDPDVMMYVFQGGKKLALRDIPRVKRPVVMTTGSHHYQTYWVTSPRYEGLMQTLPLIYLPKDHQWIPREEAFMHGGEQGRRYITQWNHHCIRCHSTQGNPGLDDKTGMLKSKVGEFGIACEACHGPGEAHVRKHSNPLSRYAEHLGKKPDDTIVNPANLDHVRSSQVCGQCHGVFVFRDEYAMTSAHEGPLYRAGEDVEQKRYYIQHPRNAPTPERLADIEKNPDFFRERWWDDGTILAGGREYTAMKDTPCFTKGHMSCLTCHSMHDSDPNDQLKTGLNIAAACVTCHTAAKYTTDLKSHTFHAVDSPGSDCLNCHMPHTTYALLTGIRSHQIQSPRVEASARYGTPNACNLCHLDRTLAWTQEHLVKRYGQVPVNLTDEQRSQSAALLWLLKGHAAQRVIAAWHMGWAPAQQASGRDWQAPFDAQLLTDPYGVIRYVAARSLRTLPGYEGFEFDFLAPPAVLAKRVEAAVEAWKPAGGGTNSPRPEILLRERGAVDMDRLRQVLAQRDNRPVNIKE